MVSGFCPRQLLRHLPHLLPVVALDVVDEAAVGTLPQVLVEAAARKGTIA